jgi:HPt (histidine-containing phosphotransfer) domain-containing protein
MATEFDYAQLDAITGGDTEFEREVLEEYLSSAPHDVARVKAAVQVGDAGATAAAAHGLKGASATVGAKGFAAIALELEKAGKSGDLSSAPEALARLVAEYDQLAQLIRAHLAKAA